MHSKKRRNGFGGYSLYPKAQPSYPGLKYLKQKSSFWIAAFALIAFVSGNMIGQHGWYAFMGAIWADGNDSMIVYDGVGMPVAKVPNYAKLYGLPKDYTYRLIPQDALMDLPSYAALQDDKHPQHDLAEQTYSVAHAGDYTTGKLHAGAHDGVDIRVPEGTPVIAMGNARVFKVADDPAGLGLYVTLKLPNVPDPKDPKKTIDLYCTTGHMSAQMVVADQIVRKGDVIGYSGKTGFATGAHVHVQCDRGGSSNPEENAPYIPYFPFTGTELREAKLSFVQAINSGFHQDRIFAYSVDPIAYVEAKYAGTKGPAIVKNPSGTDVVSANPALTDPPVIKPAKSTTVLRSERVARRLSQRRLILGDKIVVKPGTAVVTTGLIPVLTAPPASSAASSVSSISSVSAPAAPVTTAGTTVASVELQTPETFAGRSWETVRVSLLDAQGKRVANPILKEDIVIRIAYGTAEIRPQTLSALDFKDGRAEVSILPRGSRTVVLEVLGWNVLSKPIAFED